MHISELPDFLKRNPEFSISFVCESGEVITIDKCVCTSYHAKGRTMNLKILSSEQIRKVVRWTIIKINNQSFYL